MKPIILSSFALALAACQLGLGPELASSVELGSASDPAAAASSTEAARPVPVVGDSTSGRGESLLPGGDSVGVLHEDPRRYEVQLKANTPWSAKIYASLLSHDGSEIVEMRLLAEDGELLAESSLFVNIPMGSQGRQVETLSHEPAATGPATLELLCDECSTPVRYRVAVTGP